MALKRSHGIAFTSDGQVGPSLTSSDQDVQRGVGTLTEQIAACGDGGKNAHVNSQSDDDVFSHASDTTLVLGEEVPLSKKHRPAVVVPSGGCGLGPPPLASSPSTTSSTAIASEMWETVDITDPSDFEEDDDVHTVCFLENEGEEEDPDEFQDDPESSDVSTFETLDGSSSSPSSVSSM